MKYVLMSHSGEATEYSFMARAAPNFGRRPQAAVYLLARQMSDVWRRSLYLCMTPQAIDFCMTPHAIDFQ